MIFEQILSAHIRNNAGFTALCGTRLYPGVAPETPEKPYIVYDMIAETTEYAHDGEVFRVYVIQFSLFSETYANGATVRDVLKDILSGYSGDMTDGMQTVSVVSTHSITRHLYESDTGLHHFPVDFEFSIPQ